MYQKLIKPLIDVLIAGITFLILLPIFIFISVLLSFTYGGNPFFVQPRPGKNERIFCVIKFRTMNDKRDEEGNLLPDSQRLTPIGKFVRKTSLDEIPQLLNVIKGDMSLIGPRPLLVQYLPYYSIKERKRFEVRPGITGLAQVSGRNMLKWDKRLALDVDYVDNLSLVLDLKIIWRTVINVFTSKDIVVDSASIMLNLDDERRISNHKS